MKLTAPNPLSIVRPRRPAQLDVCLICKRPVTERDERSRLRGETYVHRACNTYAARRVTTAGGYRRGASRRRTRVAGTD